MKVFSILLLLVSVLVSCNEDNLVPKPPTYLRINLPDHSYHLEQSPCSASFYLADIFTLKAPGNLQEGQCAQEIDLGPLNGTLFMFYRSFEGIDSLAKLINISNDRVDEHKIKADKIDFEQIIDPDNHLFGTFFTLKGNVATNFQFYLTDSTHNFIRGEVLMNSRPNYDSLRPSLDYLKIDLLSMVKSLKWKK